MLDPGMSNKLQTVHSAGRALTFCRTLNESVQVPTHNDESGYALPFSTSKFQISVTTSHKVRTRGNWAKIRRPWEVLA